MHPKIKKHQYKIFIGAPILFILLVNIIFATPQKNTLIIEPSGNTTTTLHEKISAYVFMETNTPVNALSASITYPSQLLHVADISLKKSVIDLWVQEPKWSNELGLITFSGGSLQEGGLMGKNTIAEIIFEPVATGTAYISFADAAILTHDGLGNNIFSSANDLTYTISSQEESAQKDVNEDGKVNWIDGNIILLHIFGSYSERYDINNDGDITLDDWNIVWNFKN